MIHGVSLRLNGVWRTFGVQAPVHALAGVDLKVGAGEYVAITGRSGSGKSTLLNVVGLLERPSSGSYAVDGQNTSVMRGRELDQLRKRTLGLVFQSFHLIDYFTVAENIAVGLTYAGLAPAQRRSRVNEVIAQVGLEHRRDAPTATLSGGERQRVAIARTLARRPSVMLADEPTGNLDEANAAAILDLFDEIHARGVTVLLVTHDAAIAARCSRRILMRDGRIAEDCG